MKVAKSAGKGGGKFAGWIKVRKSRENEVRSRSKK